MRTASSTHGAESVLPFYYGGSNGALTNELQDARLFRRFGASRLARTVCAAPTGAAATAMYGKMAGVAYEDYPHAKVIVIWGANPSATGIHLVPHLKAAQQSGAKLVVIDPRRTALARQADLHLAVRPGTDLPVALALIRACFEDGRADVRFLDQHATGVDQLRALASAWTFEAAADTAGISVDDIRTLYRWYVEASPALIRCGWGPPVAVSMEQIVRRNLTIRGVHNYAPKDLLAAVEFLTAAHGQFPLQELVGPWYPLTEVVAAFDSARDPRHLRVGIRG